MDGLNIRENPIKMDDLGVPLFSETPIYTYVFVKVGGYFSPILRIWEVAVEASKTHGPTRWMSWDSGQGI